VAKDLDIIIPARNEMFLTQTVEHVLKQIRADTGVIAICDGYWPDPPLQDHPRLTVVHHDAIGQRAATNEGARISQAKYIMKLDAHCAVDTGFDAKLLEDAAYDRTLVPVMHRLHAFDWECVACGHRTYQGAHPGKCEECGSKELRIAIVWKRRDKKQPTYSWRFDHKLQFQYWREHRKRPECQGDLIETMSFIGACMLLDRERFWELGGMDENHGSWGQFGTEWACKTWLSGGKLLTSKKTWFAHMFRTGNFARNGKSSWPYPITQGDIDRARAYSRDFWKNNQWDKAVHDLQWLVDKFAPVPEWHEGE